VHLKVQTKIKTKENKTEKIFTYGESLASKSSLNKILGSLSRNWRVRSNRQGCGIDNRESNIG